MKWPVDNEAARRRRQEFADFSWGFASGIIVCVLLSLFMRNC